MVDMQYFPTIRIWDGCDPTVAAAIRQFQGRWEPYSSASRRRRIDRLIEELIDPAVATYTTTLPERYLNYVPGAGTKVSLSGMVRLTGLDAMARVQRQLLRAFVATEAGETETDGRFIATLESLIDLIRACARKPPLKSKVRDTRLNGRRAQDFCQFCGEVPELTAFVNGHDNLDDPEGMLRLSSLYCSEHRPRLPSGEWNPAYRKAKRSLVQFESELTRLSLQSGNWKTVLEQSGDPLVDSYIYHYVRRYNFRMGDEAELRNHACWMANGKLSDRKKQMIMLQRYGFGQSEIARRLGVERQAVFKALATIPSAFCELPMLPGFPHYFLSSTKIAN